MATTWHVYQFRSETELLYVGYSRRLQRRVGEHRRTKPWWSEVTEITSEEFTTEDAARQREKEIWAAERPKYNRNNPFLTHEELRARDRTYERSPESRERQRRWDRERKRTPEHRAADRRKRQDPQYKAKHKEYMREYNRTYRRPRGWRQTGPGLF